MIKVTEFGNVHTDDQALAEAINKAAGKNGKFLELVPLTHGSNGHVSTNSFKIVTEQPDE